MRYDSGLDFVNSLTEATQKSVTFIRMVRNELQISPKVMLKVYLPRPENFDILESHGYIMRMTNVLVTYETPRESDRVLGLELNQGKIYIDTFNLKLEMINKGEQWLLSTIASFDKKGKTGDVYDLLVSTYDIWFREYE